MSSTSPGPPSRVTARDALVTAARDLFTERGYHDVGTEEIVARAAVTRGALYHHFRDKQDLFRAVHEQLQTEITERIAARMAGIDDPRSLLEAGARAFLDACTDPAHVQVNLLDAPTVLGWAEWRAIDTRHGLGLATAALQTAADAGILVPAQVETLAHLLLGALGEAAMRIAHSTDPAAARADAEPALLALVRGLLTDS